MEELFAKLIRYSGLLYFIRSLTRNKVTIVLYHNPDQKVFKRHIEYLNKYYNFITLDLLIDSIKCKNWSNIPNNSIVITFDDGHLGNYKLLDTIKKYKINPTIYCCSNIVGTKRHYWWKESKVSEVDTLKRVTNKERLTFLEDKYDFRNDRVYEDRQALDCEEIGELSKLSTIASHTRFHPILTCCEIKEMKDEIFTSKKQIEKLTQTECLHFCYPNGDYNDDIIEMVKRAGYHSARTIDVGWNDLDSDPYKLKITGITDDASLNKVIAQLTGIPMFLRYMFKGGSFKGLYKSIIPRSK